jgi:putative transposase
MGRKRFSPKQIITMLREVEVLLTQGTPVAEVCRKLGVREQTCYRWKKEYDRKIGCLKNKFKAHVD